MPEDVPGYPPSGSGRARDGTVSNEMLAMKLDNYMDMTTREGRAMHGHLNEVMKRLDMFADSQGVMRDTVHDHINQSAHSGTREEIDRLKDQVFHQEQAIGQLMTWKAVSEGKWSFADKLWLVVIAAIPTTILLYNTFTR